MGEFDDERDEVLSSPANSISTEPLITSTGSQVIVEEDRTISSSASCSSHSTNHSQNTNLTSCSASSSPSISSHAANPKSQNCSNNQLSHSHDTEDCRLCVLGVDSIATDSHIRDSRTDDIDHEDDEEDGASSPLIDSSRTREVTNGLVVVASTHASSCATETVDDQNSSSSKHKSKRRSKQHLVKVCDTPASQDLPASNSRSAASSCSNVPSSNSMMMFGARPKAIANEAHASSPPSASLATSSGSSNSRASSYGSAFCASGVSRPGAAVPRGAGCSVLLLDQDLIELDSDDMEDSPSRSGRGSHSPSAKRSRSAGQESPGASRRHRVPLTVHEGPTGYRKWLFSRPKFHSLDSHGHEEDANEEMIIAVTEQRRKSRRSKMRAAETVGGSGLAVGKRALLNLDHYDLDRYEDVENASAPVNLRSEREYDVEAMRNAMAYQSSYEGYSPVPGRHSARKLMPSVSRNELPALSDFHPSAASSLSPSHPLECASLPGPSGTQYTPDALRHAANFEFCNQQKEAQACLEEYHRRSRSVDPETCFAFDYGGDEDGDSIYGDQDVDLGLGHEVEEQLTITSNGSKKSPRQTFITVGHGEQSKPAETKMSTGLGRKWSAIPQGPVQGPDAGRLNAPHTITCRPVSETTSVAGLSMTSTSSDPNAPFCKICHLHTKEGDPLISPCRCAGTMQFIHCGCLMRWLEISSKKSRKPLQCELCQYQYHWHKKFKIRHWQLPSCSRQDKLLHLLFFLALAVMLACASITVMCFRQDTETRVDPNRTELTQSEVITLVCGVVFFLAFFCAMYVEVKARNTLYKLLVKFVYLNQQWYIDEYEKQKEPGPVDV